MYVYVSIEFYLCLWLFVDGLVLARLLNLELLDASFYKYNIYTYIFFLFIVDMGWNNNQASIGKSVTFNTVRLTNFRSKY